MKYAVFFRRFDVDQWEAVRLPTRAVEAADPAGAVKACWEPGSVPRVGEWMAFPVEGSGAFGVELNLRALTLDGKPVPS